MDDSLFYSLPNIISFEGFSIDNFQDSICWLPNPSWHFTWDLDIYRKTPKIRPIIKPTTKSTIMEKLETKKIHSCDKCSYTSMFGNLTRHKNLVHSKIRHFCDECNYKSTQSTNLKKHKLIHHS